jgi:O-6-methylguanine DNA methyltransferase
MPINSKHSKAETELYLNSTIQKFDKGPLVAVHIQIENGEILSSRLSLSDQFTCIGGDARLLKWLDLYSKGIYSPLQLETGTPFQRRVMQELEQIPFGQTLSYKELSEKCGTPNGARAIGNACGRNPFVLLVPCHRVVHSDGRISGFTAGPEIKRRLLEFETLRQD